MAQHQYETVAYMESLRDELGLRAQYIHILRTEYQMNHNRALPLLNFDANVTEVELKQAKRNPPKLIKSDGTTKIHHSCFSQHQLSLQ